MTAFQVFTHYGPLTAECRVYRCTSTQLSSMYCVYILDDLKFKTTEHSWRLLRSYYSRGGFRNDKSLSTLWKVCLSNNYLANEAKARAD